MCVATLSETIILRPNRLVQVGTNSDTVEVHNDAEDFADFLWFIQVE